eukprot:5102916-Amphidinium_carterae.1
MTESYAEEEHIGKDIMQEFFTKTRLTEKQPGHRLWVNNKKTRLTPPDLDKEQSDKVIDLTVKEEIPIDIQPGGGPVNIPHRLAWTFRFHIQKMPLQFLTWRQLHTNLLTG